MFCYFLTLLLTAYLLTSMEYQSCKPNDTYDQIFAYTGILAHHFIQLSVFVTPLTPYFKHAPTYVLYLYLLMFFYVLIQNNWVNKHKKQSCVLSSYTNRKCNIPDDTPLKDPLFYAGFKKDLLWYNQMYTMVVLAMILYILWLLKNSYCPISL